MFKIFTILLLLLPNFSMQSQEEEKISCLIESQFMNINSILNFNRLGLSVTIASDYRLHPKVYAGVYSMLMKDISTNHNAIHHIMDKKIDVSSSTLSNFGIYAGYKLYNEERLTLMPEVRLGYGIYEAKSAIPNANASEHLSASMITLTPRALASYKISNGLSTGISMGYKFISYIGETKLPEYNMQNISGGVFLRFILPPNRCR
jgi:hypothetical protein